MKEQPTEKIVRVYHANRSAGGFQHGPYALGPGGYADVPESVAALWLEHKSCGIPLVTMQEAPPPNAAALAENEKLRADMADAERANKELADRLANLEKLYGDMKSASAPKIPVVEDQAPGEAAPAETVLTGKALKAAQAKAAKKR